MTVPLRSRHLCGPGFPVPLIAFAEYRKQVRIAETANGGNTREDARLAAAREVNDRLPSRLDGSQMLVYRFQVTVKRRDPADRLKE